MTRKPNAFTLTEMLVVLGIILLLMSLLIPVIISAQRQAKIAQCQSRLRSIGQALQVYMTEYDQTLPPGVTSNSKDSSLSPAALSSESIDTSMGIGGGLTPAQYAKLKYFKGAENFPYPAAPLAYYLKRTMTPSEGNWNCPVLRTGKPGKFRDYKFVATANPAHISDDSKEGNLSAGKFGVDEFKPGYMYMSGIEHMYSINKAPEDKWHEMATQTYSYAELARRSVSGLKLSEIKPVGGGLPETVVTVLDYSLVGHSKVAKDLLEDIDPTDANAVAKSARAYTANFLFLDGHVERRDFAGNNGFFKQLHGAIPQPW